MRFMGLHHIQIGIPAGSEDRARAFYGGALGLEEIPKPPHLAVRGGLWFRAGAQEVHLGIEPEHRALERAHPAFQVEDLGALRQRLLANGAEPYDDLPLPGHHRFYVKDPFGNRLEFLEPATPSR
jgi:catechol 2,3-dioxygenase-like lactoylglutathione lyase family enzyme